MKDVVALARSHTVEAVAALARIAKDHKQPSAAIVAASVALLDRGWGKPNQPTDMTVKIAPEDDRPPLDWMRAANGIAGPPETQH